MSTRRARNLRRDATRAEARLWSVLRGRQLGNWKFRRQVPIGRYVVDFYCAEAKLVVEADGGQHGPEVDGDRDRYLSALGLQVMRFWNNDILANTEGVLLTILATLPGEPPHPSPSAAPSPARGEGAVRAVASLKPSPLAGEGGARSEPGEGAVAGEGGGRPDFGVYVHWPFCLSKCPYCDFNSHVAEAIDQGRWRAALLRELAHHADIIRAGRPASLFFGGGTPSLMDPETAGAIIQAVRDLGAAPDLEVTLEANPGAAEAERFAAFRAAGVQRLSLGVQSLDEAALRFLGRRHDAGEALAALERARAVFDRVSFDLIYALPGQDEAAWLAQLDRALGLAAGHLSLYQLTIEEGTRFAHDRVAAAEEGLAARLFEVTQARMERAGLPAYEISNHAAPGQESRHNLVYWRGGHYAGIGPGAHGRLPGADGLTRATRQHRAPSIWLERVERDGHATAEDRPIPPRERAEEVLLMGLRLAEGVPRARLGEAILDDEAIARLVADGLLADDKAVLRVTPPGRLLLNAILAKIVA